MRQQHPQARQRVAHVLQVLVRRAFAVTIGRRRVLRLLLEVVRVPVRAQQRLQHALQCRDVLRLLQQVVLHLRVQRHQHGLRVLLRRQLAGKLLLHWLQLHWLLLLVVVVFVLRVVLVFFQSRRRRRTARRALLGRCLRIAAAAAAAVVKEGRHGQRGKLLAVAQESVFAGGPIRTQKQFLVADQFQTVRREHCIADTDVRS